MIPNVSILCRENAAAQVEITAFAAGAGPPAKTTATRRKSEVTLGGADIELGISRSLLSQRPLLQVIPQDFKDDSNDGQWDAIFGGQLRNRKRTNGAAKRRSKRVVVPKNTGG
jgi:hypothetical protein